MDSMSHLRNYNHCPSGSQVKEKFWSYDFLKNFGQKSMGKNSTYNKGS